MNASPLVSIALPAFNAEHTVGDAIASLLLQTHTNWELLFIDDGSTDNTVAVARSFDDPRIRIFADGANKGLPARLNEAIDRSAGKYLARMDHDDLCFPERLARQVAFLEAHSEIDLLATRALTFVAPGEALGLFPFRETHEAICAAPWNGYYMPHPTWMGRLDWFRKHRYRTPGVRRAEDQELLLRAMPDSRYACLPEVLFAYRVRGTPSLRINMTARRSLLLCQLEIFRARRQWGNALLALAAFAAKSIRDVALWLVGRREWTASAEISAHLSRWQALKARVARQQGRPTF